jgi:hypothetical protein
MALGPVRIRFLTTQSCAILFWLPALGLFVSVWSACHHTNEDALLYGD